MMRILLLLIVSSVVVRGQTLPAPNDLHGQWLPDSGIVRLRWDSLIEDIAGYHLFVQQPGQNKFYLWAAAGQIHTNAYDFKVKVRFGGSYSFRVAAFVNFPEIIYGNKSDVISFDIPSNYLPMVGGLRAEVKKNNLSFSWEYPYEITDMAGFKISVNDSTINVGAGHTEHNFQNLPKSTYSLSIIAVSKSGVKSEESAVEVVRVK